MMNRGQLITVLVTAGMVAFSAPVMADEKPSTEYGKKLFNDKALGGPANTKSCNSCHPTGKGLEKAQNSPELAQTINRCITGLLKGKNLEGNSREMQSLILYIRTLKTGGGY
jgi:cytochrome c peroxidase